MTPQYGTGWRPGLIGWTVAEHATYYANHWGFGPVFEAKVAAEMADFTTRLTHPGNQIFWAADAEDTPLGTLSLDMDETEENHAHLRWFILSDNARGHGIGQTLMHHALVHARSHRPIDGLYLWTFAGLHAARAIYEKAGFTLAQESEDTSWGTKVTEQRFQLTFRA